MLKDILISMRPKQWTKNLILFAGLVFSQNLLSPYLLLKTIAAFALFSLLSGSLYMLNDVLDLEEDRKHPLKSKRPIVRGRIGVRASILSAVLLVIASLTLSLLLSTEFFLVAVIYLILNLAYSFLVKRVVILDVLVISFGFVLRAIAGAVVIDVEISSWLLVCTVLLALFLALSKRRHELVILEASAESHRKTLSEYSPRLLDQMVSVVTASTLMAYALYTMAPETINKFGTRRLGLTIPFVLYGIFRYLYLIHKREEGGAPEKTLLTDLPLLVDIGLWIVAVGLIIYL